MNPSEKPLVSVICLCYNQEKFVEEALKSVLNQDYENIELIVIDDASTDHSAEVIRNFLKNKSNITFIPLKENLGNCKAFNQGLLFAKGKYVIDLAADDVLLQSRISEGVKALESADECYGVHFSDAEYIDEVSNVLKSHYKRNSQGQLLDIVPQGDVFKDIVGRYFICPPTTMAKKDVFLKLGGYDESLAYEDFDFFVRSSRKFKYSYTDKILVQKRILPSSLSKKQYQPGSKQLLSTFHICEKAWILSNSEEEHLALKQRIRYELLQSVISGNYEIAKEFLSLYMKRPKKNKPAFTFLIRLAILFQPNLTFLSGMKRYF